MFSIAEKQKIAKAVEDVIRSIDHPEMDKENIRFELHIFGKQAWSYANIHSNNEPMRGEPNPWNERHRPTPPRSE